MRTSTAATVGGHSGAGWGGTVRNLPDLNLKELARELSTYMLVGALSFLVYTAIYLSSRTIMEPMLANTLAFVLSGWTNTIWHRRYTFRAEKVGSGTRQQLENLVTLLLGLAITNGALQYIATDSSVAFEYTVIIVANLVAGAIHYVLLKGWVFKPGRARS